MILTVFKIDCIIENTKSYAYKSIYYTMQLLYAGIFQEIIYKYQKSNNALHHRRLKQHNVCYEAHTKNQ